MPDQLQGRTKQDSPETTVEIMNVLERFATRMINQAEEDGETRQDWLQNKRSGRVYLAQVYAELLALEKAFVAQDEPNVRYRCAAIANLMLKMYDRHDQ